ncbi:hypothetical protein N8I77_002306 [Diaporthe amygdali]|uniref:CFEM domain-containing protein n=1 Tax=Phomopsis amygdali TaxID=1214568 RepID=A0AAD9SUH5_PHOAM|nr:hypothetical protein N8I77_002306 [Diaporthe amygdali]
MRTIRYLVPALLAVTGLVSAQDLGALSSCAQNCVNNMRVSVGCVPVTDQCLCSNANFENGIRDCATQSCTEADVTAAMDYAGAFCLKATGTTTAAAATETTNTTPPPPTTTSESETTTTPTTATEPTSVTAETATSETESSTATTATTETSSTASSAATGATETSSTSSASKTTSETTSGTKASASQSASSTADAAGAQPSDSGLSVGAKAGIAVGAGAACVAIVALLIALCRTRRARRPLPRGTMQISEPLPGSGRLDYESGTQFTTRPPKSAGSKFSQMTELDQNARRYEDMLPRVSPRRMV